MYSRQLFYQPVPKTRYVRQLCATRSRDQRCVGLNQYRLRHQQYRYCLVLILNLDYGHLVVLLSRHNNHRQRYKIQQ